MNNDNMLAKIITTFNEGIFSDNDSGMKVSSMVSDALAYGGYDVSDCTFKIKNVSGNLDMCFIFGEVDNSTKVADIIGVDDARGTRIIEVIFVNNLLETLEKLKPSDTYKYQYKITDAYGKFVGFASDFSIDGNYAKVKKKDFDRKVDSTDVKYQIPSNRRYIDRLIYIFRIIIDLVRPYLPTESVLGRIYAHAAEVLALYSHNVTIGPVTKYECDNVKLLDIIKNNDLGDILDGKVLEAFDDDF